MVQSTYRGAHTPFTRYTSTGLLAPGFSPGRDDPGVLQLRVAQLISHGFRAGKGGLCRGFAVPRLRGGSSGSQGTALRGDVVLGGESCALLCWHQSAAVDWWATRGDFLATQLYFVRCEMITDIAFTAGGTL